MTVQTAKPRTYVVTGSASGIGAATALMLRARGDRVVGVDLKNADVEVDLSTAVDRCRAVDACLDATEGLLDALILCSGLRDPLPDTVSVNYFGSIDLLVGFRDALAISTSPRAVLISSVAAVLEIDRAILDACLRHDENGARHKQSSRQRRVLVAVPGRTHQQKLRYRSGYGKTLYCTRGPVAGYWSTPLLPAQSRLR